MFMLPAMLLALLASLAQTAPATSPAADGEPAAGPRMLPPTVGSAQLLTDVTKPPHRLPLPKELTALGASVWGLFKICVDTPGSVASVAVVRPAHPSVDQLWADVIKTWKYRPYTVAGEVVAFCYVSRLQHGDRDNAPPGAIIVSPVVGTGQLLTDVTKDPYRPRMSPELSIAGNTAWGVFKVCVAAAGTVQSVKPERSAHPSVDGQWMDKIRTWKYRPYTLDGKPTPFCYNLRLQVSAQGDPSDGSLQRITDVSKPPHKLELPPQMKKGTIVSGVYEICVNQLGNVYSVQAVTPAPPEVNETWMKTIRGWKYLPHRPGGHATSSCFQRQLQLTAK